MRSPRARKERTMLTCLIANFLAGGLDVPVKAKDGPLGMKFVPLPKGTFYKGYLGKASAAKKAEIKEDFEIAIHTVTQGQWQAVMGSNPSEFSRLGRGKDKVAKLRLEELAQLPVERVSWDDAQQYINK